MSLQVKTERRWKLRSQTLNLSAGTKVMAILNVTPDSFSDGGRFQQTDDAVRQAELFVNEGASIIDVGGESTRPGSSRVSAEAEIDRIAPVIEKISRELGVVVSVDTSKSSVAKAAIEAGAEIVNDISGLKFDGSMASIAAEAGAGLVLMHLEGDFESMHNQINQPFIGKTVVAGLRESLDEALLAGVEKNRICLDVGIGFSKTLGQNLELLRCLCDISDCFPGVPMMVGVSRKSFIGNITGEAVPENRLAGTIAANCVAILNGADIIRVHDVKAAVDSIKMLDAIRGKR